MRPTDNEIQALSIHLETVKRTYAEGPDAVLGQALTGVGWSNLTAILRREASIAHSELLGLLYDGKDPDNLRVQLYRLAAVALLFARYVPAHRYEREEVTT